MESAWTLARLFSLTEVAAALTVVADADRLYGASALHRFCSRRRLPSSNSSGNNGSGNGFIALKQHLDIPLDALATSAEVRAVVTPAIMHVCKGLRAEALRYVQVAMCDASVPPLVRNSILNDFGARSVLRLLRYERGVGCRPHVDPGLCTAMLLGSHGGLEVNPQICTGSNSRSSCDGAGEQRPGDVTSCCDESGGSKTAGGGNPWDSLPGWMPVPSTPHDKASDVDVLTMNGSMLQAVSSGALPGVLHRVRYDWADIPNGDHGLSSSCGAARCNIIVELRPAKPKQWYGLIRESKRERTA